MSAPAPVVVVGAGISGVACARELVAAGLPVRLVDRGRSVGGRMAVRTVQARTARTQTAQAHAVDIGASYFTVSEPAFAAVAEDWRSRGLARPWTDTFHLAGPAGLGDTKSGPVRWAAKQGLRSLVEQLASGLDVEHGVTVSGVAPGSVDGAAASAVVLAMPDPQAARLLGDGLPEAAGYQPSLVLAAGYDARTWPAFDAAFVSDDPALTFVADDGRRRGDDALVLVAHSTPELAREHLAEPAAATGAMLEGLRRVLGVDSEPSWSLVHRWTFAQPTGSREQPFALSDDLVGRCGDAWSQRPRVEAAFESGRALGLELARRLVAVAGH